MTMITITPPPPQPFYGPFSESVPEENFWILWCKGRLTEADTLTILLGVRTNQCPPPPSPPNDDDDYHNIIMLRKTIWRHRVEGLGVITGSIARSANLPVFSLLRGRF